MDNITHSLTGLAMARAGLNRLSPRATLLLLVSANAPDIDIVAAPWGALKYLEVHRGYTHSLLVLPLLAAVCVLLVAAIYRQKLPWLGAWVVCCAGVASHLLLDWTNTYGIRLLLPFSSRWFYLDSTQLSDGVIMIALLVAAAWPMFSRLVGSEIGERQATKGRGIAVAALLFFVLFDVGRYLMHERAIAQLAAREYDDGVPVSVSALPTSFNPFRWTGIVETANAYRSLEVNTLGDLDPQSAIVVYKRPFDAVIESARKTAPFRFFQYFSRFPAWSEEPVFLPNGTATRVDLTDLRFGAPGVGSFHCIALVDSRSRVLESVFTFGPGTTLGRSAE